MAIFASSYIKTNGAALTRNRDQLSFPYNARPQAMTVYVRFVERGKGISRALWAIESTARANPRLEFSRGASNWVFNYINAAGTVIGTGIDDDIDINDMGEFVCQVSAAGSLTILKSVNSATATTSTASATQTLPQTWSDQRFVVGALGATTIPGYLGLTNAVITRGVQSLETMRRIAGTK